jgi:hypothetical protein
MQVIQPAAVSVTDVVYDHMLIEINNTQLRTKNFEYRICTKDKKLVRQGSFRGPMVQIRLSLMDTGIYQLLLSNDGQEWQQYPFEKKAARLVYA